MLEDSLADNLSTIVLKLRVENQLKEAAEKSAPLIFVQAGHEQRCKPSVAWIKHWEEGVRSSNSKINPDKTKKEKRSKQR